MCLRMAEKAIRYRTGSLSRLLLVALSLACASCSLCADGRPSFSTGSGTCSRHGGVAFSLPTFSSMLGWLLVAGAGASLWRHRRRLVPESVRHVLRFDGSAGKQRPTPPSPPQSTRIKILFLAANPTSSSQLNLSREARRIEERIDAGGRRQSTLEFVTRWAVRPSDLQRALLEERPHVLHFSGHGTRHSGLLFEDDDGNAIHVEKEALVNLIGILPGNLRLVVLNACDSEPIAEGLVRHVPCAIGMRAPIDNDAAVAFSASFYQALGFDESVATAFRLGCNELELRGIPEEGIPSLKVRRGGDASRLVLTAP